MASTTDNTLEILDQIVGSKMTVRIVKINDKISAQLLDIERSREVDISMMLDPSRWPMKTRLPLVRDSKTEREVGFIVSRDVLRAGGHSEITVYCEMVWFTPSKVSNRITYSNIEAMYDAGWRVD